MEVHGVIRGGVVVLSTECDLTEGTEVSIVPVDRSRPLSGDESEPTIGQKLAALAPRMESLPCDLPEDLAENHDHYSEGNTGQLDFATDPHMSLAERMQKLAEWCETLPTDLPSDLSVNHDHYLYGTPKRQ